MCMDERDQFELCFGLVETMTIQEKISLTLKEKRIVAKWLRKMLWIFHEANFVEHQ